MSKRFCAHGLTLVEALVVIVIGVIVLVAACVILGGGSRHGHGQGMMKDATQVRGIEQAMVVWANENKGDFPLPSLIDLNDATVQEKGAAKDHTANILSMLIYAGHISTDLTISIAESHYPAIQQDENYELEYPKTAVDPAKALWDPAFSADFTGGKIGNTSYAHLLPAGPRKALWRDNFSTTQPIIGNRGPEIASYTRAKDDKINPVYSDTKSFTFLIHGSRNAWEGNIAYNDGHVSFETRLDPEGVHYRAADNRYLSDCLFYDEQDDANGTNAFLGIFTKAGEATIDYHAIWD